jgi:hypothetical protein
LLVPCYYYIPEIVNASLDNNDEDKDNSTKIFEFYFDDGDNEKEG